MTPKERADALAAELRAYSAPLSVAQARFVLDALTAAIAEEREACAKVCDDKAASYRAANMPRSCWGSTDCAEAIRARGSK